MLWFYHSQYGPCRNAVVALQEHAQTAADAFCSRDVQSPKRKSGIVRHNKTVVLKQCPRPTCLLKPRRRQEPGSFYRPRNHEASPFFKIVRDRFDEFERVYPERYQERYGYWRPVIRSSVDKILKPVVSLSNHAAARCGSWDLSRKRPQ